MCRIVHSFPRTHEGIGNLWKILNVRNNVASNRNVYECLKFMFVQVIFHFIPKVGNGLCASRAGLLNILSKATPPSKLKNKKIIFKNVQKTLQNRISQCHRLRVEHTSRDFPGNRTILFPFNFTNCLDIDENFIEFSADSKF